MKKLTYILMLLFLFSCLDKGPKKPKNLISKEKMTDLLFDMHIAKQTKNIKNLDKKKNVNYFYLISKKHGIDSTQFKNSHTYYMHNISEYQEIYKKIENKLDTLLKKEEEKNKINDSIKKIEKGKKKELILKRDLKPSFKKLKSTSVNKTKRLKEIKK